MNDQERIRFFWRLVGRLQAGITLLCSVAGYAIAGINAAVSVAVGGVIGWFSLALLNFTVALLVRTGMQKASKGAGKMLRGALFLSRLILLVVAIGLLFTWKGLQPAGLAVGLTVTQVSIIAAGTLTLKYAHSSEH